MKDESVLIIFGEELPHEWSKSARHYDVVIASESLKQDIEEAGSKFVALESLVETESIYEASSLLEELSYLKFPDGTRITKSFLYKGYELWWMHYDSLFYYFCLPYTQYKKLLEYIKDFEQVSAYRLPNKNLFSCYLQAYEREMTALSEPQAANLRILPFGVFLQIVLSLLSLPILVVMRRRLLVYTGDKFAKGKDYDFRMQFVYEELRQKKIPFVEFIRGIESWKTVLEHAYVRRRPVIYSETAVFGGRFISILSGGQRRARREFGAQRFTSEADPEKRFKLAIATQYLLSVYDDVWAIRIMQWIMRAIGVRVALIPSASDRSFHAVLGCKLNKIPTIGIMHGVASRHYNVYEFMPGFDGERMMSVDRYGLWSEWWRTHFEEYSRAYKPEQLFVSGPMRPLETSKGSKAAPAPQGGLVRVLFVAEQNAVPTEVIPYLRELLGREDIELTLKFRQDRDGFEQWLLQHEPDIFKRKDIRIAKGNMQDALAHVDVAVGCQSTGVLETLLRLKVPIYFRTRKWGDYYSLKAYDGKGSFFAESPKELVERVHNAKLIPSNVLEDLRERYFGDPYKNGSRWVVEQAEQLLQVNVRS